REAEGQVAPAAGRRSALDVGGRTLERLAEPFGEAGQDAADPRAHGQAEVVGELAAADELPHEGRGQHLARLALRERGLEVDDLDDGAALGGVDRLGVPARLEGGGAHDVPGADQVDEAAAA